MDLINLQAAVGLDGDTSNQSVSAMRKTAMLRFFANLGEGEVNSHHLEYSNTVVNVIIE